MTQPTIGPRAGLAPGQTAFLFDLDGTLVDSVYQHVYQDPADLLRHLDESRRPDCGIATIHNN